jgi:hypothetical protein
MVSEWEGAFPRLLPESYRVTSPPSNRYNCIAWAAGDLLNWWWPVSDSRFYWPPGVTRTETLVRELQADRGQG